MKQQSLKRAGRSTTPQSEHYLAFFLVGDILEGEVLAGEVMAADIASEG
jgi:hypothetical protein